MSSRKRNSFGNFLTESNIGNEREENENPTVLLVV